MLKFLKKRNKKEIEQIKDLKEKIRKTKKIDISTDPKEKSTMLSEISLRKGGSKSSLLSSSTYYMTMLQKRDEPKREPRPRISLTAMVNPVIKKEENTGSQGKRILTGAEKVAKIDEYDIIRGFRNNIKEISILFIHQSYRFNQRKIVRLPGCFVAIRPTNSIHLYWLGVIRELKEPEQVKNINEFDQELNSHIQVKIHYMTYKPSEDYWIPLNLLDFINVSAIICAVQVGQADDNKRHFYLPRREHDIILKKIKKN